MSMTASGEIVVDVSVLEGTRQEIAELDEQLQAASGSATAGKRSIANEYAERYSETWEPNVTQVEQWLASLDEDELVGAYTAINKAIRGKYAETVDKVLEIQFDERKDQAPTFTDAQITEMVDARKEKVKHFRALKELLKMFGQEVDHVADPPKWVGTRGPRGKRVWGKKYRFSIGERDNDGNVINLKERTDSQNSLSSIAATVMKTETRELQKILADAGITDTPPDEGEVDFPDANGKTRVLRWVKTEVAEVEDEEDEDDDENGDDE